MFDVAHRQDERFAAVFARVYSELRAMAQLQMNAERPDHSLHATELVHEAYLRLTGPGEQKLDLEKPSHFFHAAGEAMRRILIEHARKRSRVKRGGHRERVTLSLVDVVLPEEPQDLLALDEALRRMEEQDPRAAEVVRLRFFAGLTIEQAADVMELSPRTVKREWEFARAWLSQQLQ
jgi:RNA polymerase sigma factor (TIGR02999 family)